MLEAALADTMMPEAFEAESRSPWTGAATTLGFALSALLTTLSRLARAGRLPRTSCPALVLPCS
jgi:hypothetical protein